MEKNVPQGRKVVEDLLKAAKKENAPVQEVSTKDDPYYWEPEYPDEKAESLSLYTIVSHNVHYFTKSALNLASYCGDCIIDFLGMRDSDYEWIQQELDRDKEEEEYYAREKKMDEEYSEAKKRAQMERLRDKTEKGDMA